MNTTHDKGLAYIWILHLVLVEKDTHVQNSDPFCINKSTSVNKLFASCNQTTSYLLVQNVFLLKSLESHFANKWFEIWLDHQSVKSLMKKNQNCWCNLWNILSLHHLVFPSNAKQIKRVNFKVYRVYTPKEIICTTTLIQIRRTHWNIRIDNFQIGLWGIKSYSKKQCVLVAVVSHLNLVLCKNWWRYVSSTK